MHDTTGQTPSRTVDKISGSFVGPENTRGGSGSGAMIVAASGLPTNSNSLSSTDVLSNSFLPNIKSRNLNNNNIYGPAGHQKTHQAMLQNHQNSGSGNLSNAIIGVKANGSGVGTLTQSSNDLMRDNIM